MPIKYPIVVSNIYVDHRDTACNKYRLVGKLVHVCPCSDNPDNKTYVGLFLGELIRGAIAFHNPNDGELRIVNDYNPAIFVPELGRIVWGCGSFWRPIKRAEDLDKVITQSDIENTWYVKLLQAQLESGDEKETSSELEATG